MAWFWQKKETPKITVPSCKHKYRDFPWYLDGTVRSNNEVYSHEKTWTVKIMEPYVCVHCGHRKDICLVTYSGYGADSDKDAVERMRFLEARYPEQLKDRPVVEDMIMDMQLVDREYLEMMDGLLVPKIKVEESSET